MPDQEAPHCQRCGAQAGEDNPYEPGHPILVTIASEPLDETGQTRFPTFVCSLCSEGARSLAIERPSSRALLVQVRRAAAKDQYEVFDWLRTKFAHV